MKIMKLLGWGLALIGIALWVYGYFRPGSRSLVDWSALTPWWIADYLPNMESELGLFLVCIAMIPLYWPENAERSNI